MVLVSSIECEPKEIWVETRDIIKGKCRKTIYVAKWKKKLQWMIDETVKIAETRWEAKARRKTKH